ncbi:S1 RNA-binding domain-containing protein 1 [Portunus trituberculatus]|uniref:S1 RNA-binding domain-containing protein 1 n=1 Tax=Portunus trituberculatus TaxID=210409 RepID=A0A5B7EJD9_PORTR|nr:S1 RNA-binding domain-containing protein 1 [Portunus trituberculatus]
MISTLCSLHAKMSTQEALDSSIEILEEVQNVRPMNSGVALEVEVLYDGDGSSSNHPQIIQVGVLWWQSECRVSRCSAQANLSSGRHVQERVVKILKTDNKKLPDDRKVSLLRATTMHEVEHLTAAYKGSGKRTYAERARELGLGPAALEVLQGTQNKFIDQQELYPLIDPNREGLRSVEEILAMNRGDHQGVLSVKIVIPENTYRYFFNFCQQKWLGHSQHYRTQLVMMSTEDSWERLGFSNGCKIGVTNPNGDKLLTTTIYPFRGNQQMQVEDWTKDHNARTLREIVHKFGCELFAVGNGCGCRETETYLSRLIAQKCFEPYNVQYTIINETGASQYSVSAEAKMEFPDLDPNHISALSLARRLQDPLLEYIKVHPMHMGVGMYQHDIPERILHASLDSVMTECVSFVGVDINCASEFVLRKLSGLNKSRAANIVEYRKTKGPFINREQLKSVKGVGPRTFEQCVGFIRIMPETLANEVNRTPQGKKRAAKEPINPLDRTMIHPESYDAASKFTGMVGVHQHDIGSEHFIRTLQHFMQTASVEDVARQCEVSLPTMQLIIEGLAQPLDYDIRAQFEKPLFRQGVTSIDDISLGTKLTGSVRNVVHFGAFVDVGLGQDGLVHSSRMGGIQLELGNVVEVTVVNLDKARGRIGLMLHRVLS